MKVSSFSQEVISFLDERSEQYPSILWWATLLSSKHRFYSGTKKLQRFLSSGNYEKPEGIRPLLFLQSLKLIFLAVVKKTALLGKSKPSKSKSYYSIVKTLSYSNSFKPDGFEDPFLKELTSYLSEEKEVFILYEHLGPFFKDLSKIRKCSSIFNIYQFLNYSDALSVLIILIKNLFRKKRETKSEKDQFIENNFQVEIIAPWVCHHLLLYRAFKNILSEYKTSYIHTTYENGNWEKMLVLARNSSGRDVEIISHQHVPISEAALNYFPGKEEFKIVCPNYIVTTGQIPKELILKNSDYREKNIIVGCGLRFSTGIKRSQESREKVILAALDGTGEAGAVLEYLNTNKDLIKEQGFKVMVRFHPIFNESKMGPFLSFKLEENIDWEISRTSLKQDLEKANIVAYWGSTVGFEALANNIPVVCVRGKKDLLSNDPLWGVSYHKWEVGEGDSILSILTDFKKGQEYWPHHSNQFHINHYFEEVNKVNIGKFIVS